VSAATLPEAGKQHAALERLEKTDERSVGLAAKGRAALVALERLEKTPNHPCQMFWLSFAVKGNS